MEPHPFLGTLSHRRIPYPADRQAYHSHPATALSKTGAPGWWITTEPLVTRVSLVHAIPHPSWPKPRSG